MISEKGIWNDIHSTYFAFLPYLSLKDLLGPKNTSSSESESEVHQTANVRIIFQILLYKHLSIFP